MAYLAKTRPRYSQERNKMDIEIKLLSKAINLETRASQHTIYEAFKRKNIQFDVVAVQINGGVELIRYNQSKFR